MKENRDYLLQLDGLRFFAVSSVMFGHWMTYQKLQQFNGIIASCGVNLFFVLSGFLISQILIKAKLKNDQNIKGNWFTLKQFYIRRFLRIFPIYYLTVFIGYLINFEPAARDHVSWFLTYTTNILWGFNIGKPGHYGHFWSLAVEEQFYIFFPFLILFFKKQHLLKLLIILTTTGVFSRILLYQYDVTYCRGYLSYCFTPSCLDCFGIGGILAYLYCFKKEKLNNILNFKTPLYVATILFIFLSTKLAYNNIPYLSSVFRRFIFSIVCFYISGIASTKGFTSITKLILENKIIIYIGKISYGVYLYHYFIKLIFDYLIIKFDINLKYNVFTLPIHSLTYFLVTILLASISWFLIEKRINNLKFLFPYNR